jgi:Sulfotransferase family
MNHIETTRKTRDDLFTLAENPVWAEITTKNIRTVVVILSSSRSGSTLLAELLKQTPQLLSLQGEHVPFYKLNGFSFPANQLESDWLVQAPSRDFSEISRDFISEIGNVTTSVDFRSFAFAVVLRLTLQWPQFGLSAQEWLAYAYDAHRRLLHRDMKWQSNLFLLELSRLLCADGYNINPYYYDLPKEALQASFPLSIPPQGPPHPDFCLEEPPFVVVKPHSCPTVDEIRRKPLLLKASVDAYRLPFLRQLFPHAQFKVIHLTRNPAACINGLYDGWLNHGFFSHNVKDHAVLSIAGYSHMDEWGKFWWNYDLPPNWKTMINDPLEYVCAFQWYHAHTYILEYSSQKYDIEVMRVKFEHIICSPQQRWRTIQKITKFLEIECDQPLQTIMTNMPVVMATVTPHNRRWHTRKAQLLPVVTQNHMCALSHELGYSFDEEWL